MPPSTTTPPQGVLVIDKPADWTSHDVVAYIRRSLKVQRVGHTGTLDPFATGVLLITVGNATRLGEYTHGLPKKYETTIQLGASSTTDDYTGTLTPSAPPVPPTPAAVEAVVAQFRGTTTQVPPFYAAIKVAGKKLYEYARAGEAVTRVARSITVHNLTIQSYQYPVLKLSITCSSGTYIRALARDIGEALGVGAYVVSLRRTAIGKFTVKQAIRLETQNQRSLRAALRPAADLLTELPVVITSATNVAQLRQGRALLWPTTLPAATPLALFDEAGRVVGIGTYDAATRLLSPTKVL